MSEVKSSKNEMSFYPKLKNNLPLEAYLGEYVNIRGRMPTSEKTKNVCAPNHATLWISEVNKKRDK